MTCEAKNIQELSESFSKAYRAVFKVDCTTVVLDADAWVSAGKEISAITRTASGSMVTPGGDQVLLIVGSESNSAIAFQCCEREREDGGRNCIVYRPRMMPSAVSKTPVIDLHCHTVYSDGTSTPTEVINEAARLKLKALSITDHDSLDAYVREPGIFATAESLGLHLVPGVEAGVLDINTLWDAFGGRGTMHVLLFFPQRPSETTEQHMARLTAVNDKLAQRRYCWPLAVTHLLLVMKRDYPKADITMPGFLYWLNELNRKQGLPVRDVSWTDACPCDDFSFWERNMPAGMIPGEMPLRYHDNKVVQYTMEMIKGVYDLPAGVEDVFQFFRYVHTRPDHYLGRPEDFPDWYALRVEQVVELAHEFNGLAVYAHPLEGRRNVGAGLHADRMRAIKFDGIEVYATLHTGAECLFLGSIGGLQTGGSDFHGGTVNDMKLGIGRPGHAGMQTTFEMVKSLIEAGMLKPEIMDEIEWTAVPSIQGL